MGSFFFKKTNKRWLAVAAVLLVFGNFRPAFAQDEPVENVIPEFISTEKDPASNVQKTAVELREIPESDWQKVTGNLDFSDDLPDEPMENKPRNLPKSGGPNLDFGAMSGPLQALFILLGAALIGWLVYRFALGPRAKNLRPGELLEISPLDDLDGRLLESDLERMLRDAIETGQFSLAVRLQYLLIIKELSRKNFIDWRREKTNRDYLNELAPTGLAPDFRKITGVFERIWYGEEAVDAARFEEIEPVFRQFFEKIHG